MKKEYTAKALRKMGIIVLPSNFQGKISIEEIQKVSPEDIVRIKRYEDRK